ncbi:hypothetical protein GAY29_06540 [Azospirillum brasilense]|uniref:hypothetical protein n=1 Tax=Azospirillum brasilense TaxID=192 RepID=UPI00190AF71E|nr:hypothetical protein [Azospirillum brasilense]MBK3732772.1 hypothetical protein [Azospirillum brasilense]
MTGYKLPPSIEKSQRIAAAFEAKVTLLESWGLHGIPEDILLRAEPDGTFKPEDLPLDNAKLRRWQGPRRDLATWSDPTIDRPGVGKHPELSKRFAQAVKNIRAWINMKKGNATDAEINLEAMKKENDRLREQISTVMGEIQQLKEDLGVARAILRQAGLMTTCSNKKNM